MESMSAHNRLNVTIRSGLFRRRCRFDIDSKVDRPCLVSIDVSARGIHTVHCTSQPLLGHIHISMTADHQCKTIDVSSTIHKKLIDELRPDWH